MDDLFKKYRKRLMYIGIFKSSILSLSIALMSVGLFSIVTWIIKPSFILTLSLILGIGFGIFIISILIFYFKLFRPTPRMIAKQLDSLGQDERYITMLECGANTSQMANLQREDAKTRLSGISVKNLKFTIALPVILLLVFGVVFATGTTTMSMLTVANEFNSSEIDNPQDEQTKFYTVTYKVYEEGTGFISGQSVQEVEEGHYTKEVMAIPAEGYRFSAWVDEDLNRLANQTNPRAEVNVHENMIIYALFEKRNDNEDGGNGDGELGEGDDKQNQDKNEGDGSESGGEVGGGETGQGNAGGGESEGRENNKVIDGTQDYRDNFDREQLENELNNKDVPDDLKDILGDYYGTLKP